MPGNDSCEKQHKVRIRLMCPFVEKSLKFKKVCGSGPKSAEKNCPVMHNQHSNVQQRYTRLIPVILLLTNHETPYN